MIWLCQSCSLLPDNEDSVMCQETVVKQSFFCFSSSSQNGCIWKKKKVWKEVNIFWNGIGPVFHCCCFSSASCSALSCSLSCIWNYVWLLLYFLYYLYFVLHLAFGIVTVVSHELTPWTLFFFNRQLICFWQSRVEPWEEWNVSVTGRLSII